MSGLSSLPLRRHFSGCSTFISASSTFRGHELQPRQIDAKMSYDQPSPWRPALASAQPPIELASRRSDYPPRRSLRQKRWRTLEECAGSSTDLPLTAHFISNLTAGGTPRSEFSGFQASFFRSACQESPTSAPQAHKWKWPARKQQKQAV